MTPDQLEREIHKAIEANMFRSDDRFAAAKAVVQICRQKMREVAEKAWTDSFDATTERWNGEIKEISWDHTDEKLLEKSKTEWLKENNLLNDNT